ncbi:MAG: DsbA family protein [Proteobacteria bacterium]|nr:DsbA family protein [Pseudomonadota bacterium]MDA1302271.1 DsbA family protein [Pseudomonadota bacterium]
MSATQLQVYIDFKSPYAYVAKDAIFALANDFDVVINWLPLTLNIGSYLGTARKESGRVVESNRSPRQWLAVKYAYMDCRRYANSRGLVLKGTQKIWDSSIAAIGLLYVNRQGDAGQVKRYIDHVYERFWRRELDIEDPFVVLDVVRQADVNADGFLQYLNGVGRAEHDALQEQILDAGCFGVPTLVIDNEMYFGREHLPEVRWHLGGKSGARPDIAYDTRL